MSEPGNGITPIRVKLRRIYDKNEFIEKNLQNMQLKSFNKKYAQSRYYGRKNMVNVINDNGNSKMPVHARLGMKRINLRRGAYQFSNNNDFINNRFPLRRRLIRNQGIPPAFQNRLRLRRGGTRIFPNKTTDYTIQIRNNLANSNYNMMNNMKHSCIGQLNDQLQNEISVIQREADNAPPEVIPSLPIHVAGYGVTNVSLNQRFSM